MPGSENEVLTGVLSENRAEIISRAARKATFRAQKQLRREAAVRKANCVLLAVGACLVAQFFVLNACLDAYESAALESVASLYATL